MTTTAAADLLTELPRGLLIGGVWQEATGSETLEVEDPATGTVLATIASATPQDGSRAVEAAAAALPGWAATPPRERAEVLRRAYELMVSRAQALAELIVQENGKALADARAEVGYAAEFFRWYSEEAVRALGTVGTAPSGDKRMLVERQPVGVALLVTPWNFPAAMATRKLGPALAAGCTAVLKPSTEAPLTSLAVATLLEEAGAPPGVVNVVSSRDSAGVVSSMLAHPSVRKVSFTGSTAVGRLLLKQAADRIVNCSMELGGNAPFLVFADADIDAAVEGAMIAKMRNGGAACTAANRFYVQRPVVREFTRRLADAMASLRVGPGLEDDVQLGPLVSANARQTVAALVADAVAQGATLATGGGIPDRAGYFFEPTVLCDVPPDAAVLHNEIFGPVAPIVPFDTEAEALAAANATEYGLVSYVYSEDLRLALRTAERLESGMVAINRGLVSDAAAPFGGIKQSGLGREGAHDGLLEYLETKYVALSW